MKGPTVAHYQETAYNKDVFDDPQTSFLDGKRCKIVILAVIYWYIVFGSYGSVFDIEYFTCVHINRCQDQY